MLFSHDNERSERILLVGEKRSGKTSLAFKFAYENAMHGGSPLFICNKNKIEAQCPLLTRIFPDEEDSYKYSSWSPDVLSKINMKYLNDKNELKRLMAGLHLFTPTPTLIIIEDFSCIIDPLHNVSRKDNLFIDLSLTLLAFIDDAINYLSKNNNSKILLLITDECEDTYFMSIVNRYVNNIYNIQKATPINSRLVYLQNMKRNSDTKIIYDRMEINNGQLILFK